MVSGFNGERFTGERFVIAHPIRSGLLMVKLIVSKLHNINVTRYKLIAFT